MGEGMFDYKLEAKPCPCGECPNFVASPLFYNVEAAITEGEVKELIHRWNSYPALIRALEESLATVRTLTQALEQFNEALKK